MASIKFTPQFIERQHISTSFGNIETVDIKPLHPKTSVPVLFAPGWRETPELEKDCLYEIFIAQRRVLTLRHSLKTHTLETENSYPQTEFQKAKTLLEFLKVKGIKKTDVITHSEGAINVSIAALLHPDYFRNLILITPAGIAGKNSAAHIAFGFARHLAQSSSSITILRHGMSKRKTQEKLSLLENLQVALQEGKAIASFDIHPLLLQIRKLRVKVAVLVGEKDTVFPLNKVKVHLSKLAHDKNYGLDIFATKPGGHELYSKSKEIMAQVELILTKLEKRDSNSQDYYTNPGK